MLDYENQRKLIVIFILAVILVIIVTVVSLIMIWMPKAVEEEQSFDVGRIKATTITQDSVVKEYYKELYILFLNKNVNKLYQMTSKDYLKYYDKDLNGLGEFLYKKGVLGKALELVSYTSYTVPGYNNVYELDLKSNEEAYSINVVIKEISPQNYTIAYDMFIDYEENAYDVTVNSVQMNIYKRIRYTNSVQFEFTLKNNYNDKIVINQGGNGNPIIMVNSSNETKRPIINSINAAEISLSPKEKISGTIVFDIEDKNDYYFFRKLVVKGVNFSNINGNKNLEYNLY